MTHIPQFPTETPMPHWFFWKSATFTIEQILGNKWEQSHQEAFLHVLLLFLEWIFQILQNSNIFASCIIKINPFLHFYDTKFIKSFSLFTHFEFSQNFSLKSKIFFIFRLSPLCMNEQKWKKVLGNKTGITSYPWTVCSESY